MRILGIDLATEPKKTGVVRLEVADDGSAVARRVDGRPDDDALARWARNVDVIGVDAPLGWPIDFVKAVGAHSRSEPWPAGSVRASLRHRTTDIVVHDLTLLRHPPARRAKTESLGFRSLTVIFPAARRPDAASCRFRRPAESHRRG